jgi:hypothetical protein
MNIRLLSTVLVFLAIFCIEYAYSQTPPLNIKDTEFRYAFQIPSNWIIIEKPEFGKSERFTIKSPISSIVKVVVGTLDFEIRSIPLDRKAFLQYCLKPYTDTVNKLNGVNSKVGKHEIHAEKDGFFVFTDMIFQVNDIQYGLSGFQFFRYNTANVIFFMTTTSAMAAVRDKKDIGLIFNSFHTLK